MKQFQINGLIDGIAVNWNFDEEKQQQALDRGEDPDIAYVKHFSGLMNTLDGMKTALIWCEDINTQEATEIIVFLWGIALERMCQGSDDV